MEFLIGVILTGVVIAVWAYTPGSWPFNEEKNRRPGESKLDWERRIEALKKNPPPED